MTLLVRLAILAIIFQISISVKAKGIAESTAQTCVACHGAHGVSVNSFWPNLAGQKKDYLVKQLHEFREATRKNLIMSPMAQTLSDKDIEDLASYFSEITK